MSFGEILLDHTAHGFLIEYIYTYNYVPKCKGCVYITFNTRVRCCVRPGLLVGCDRYGINPPRLLELRFKFDVSLG